MKTFCARTDLTNESDVELFFIVPLLKYLGYKNSQIKNKKSLKELGVRKSPRGKSTHYRPDFLVAASQSAQFIVEAKSPSENLEDWTWQPKAYSVILNSEHKQSNPVQYYMLSNGLETRVYRWDYDQPVFRKLHSEMAIASPSLDELRDILAPSSLKSSSAIVGSRASLLELSKPGIEEINEAFATQVLANMRIFESKELSKQYLGLGKALGAIDPDSLNVNGGAIAVGHPVGSSGTRLVHTILRELKKSDKTIGLATLCVGGGQGAAFILERLN